MPNTPKTRSAQSLAPVRLNFFCLVSSDSASGAPRCIQCGHGTTRPTGVRNATTQVSCQLTLFGETHKAIFRLTHAHPLHNQVTQHQEIVLPELEPIQDTMQSNHLTHESHGGAAFDGIQPPLAMQMILPPIPHSSNNNQH